MAGEPREEIIKRLAKIALTEYQIAYVLNVNLDEVKKHQSIIDKNLPKNFMKIRLKRYAKTFGLSAKYGAMRIIYPKFRIESNIRVAIKYHLKNKTNHTFGILGYTCDELMAHLEKQFDKGMNWDNYGSDWHIDHKIPASWFNYKEETDKQFIECWGLKNLQPKWAKENISKNNNYADDKGQLLLVMK